MLSPYPEVLEILHRRASQVTLAIATAKDRRSVRTLLRDYGIESLFREDLVLDKETGVTKRSHLEHLQQSLAVPFDAITSGLGVRCGLAAWGYNGKREWEGALRAGHLVLHLHDLETQLFG
jgi:phosphoglycolate phosphatase-like HAD superfamily hydrolase